MNGFPQKVIDLADEMGISTGLYDIKTSHKLSNRQKGW